MKKWNLTLALLVIVLIACKEELPMTENCTTCIIPTDGLVAHYKLDGNADDATQLANHGEVVGATFTENRKGAIAQSANFDGENDYIEIQHTGAINFGADQDFSVSVWVKFQDQEELERSDNTIVSKWLGGVESGLSPGYPFVVRVSNQTHDTPGMIYGARYDGSIESCRNSGNVSTTGHAFNDDLFHHIVFLKSSTILKIYVDGIFLDEGADDTTSSCGTQNESSLFLGIRKLDGSNAFKGAIDDLRIYNRVLEESEIQCLFEE